MRPPGRESGGCKNWVVRVGSHLRTGTVAEELASWDGGRASGEASTRRINFGVDA